MKHWSLLVTLSCLGVVALGAQGEGLVPDGPRIEVALGASASVMASNSRGDTVLARSDGQDIVVQRRAPSGELVGEPLILDSGEGFLGASPAVGIDAAGNFVVAWLAKSTFPGLPPSPDLLFQRFDRFGLPLGDVDRAFPRFVFDSPAVAVRGDGSFAVLGIGQEAQDQRAVYLRRFDSRGEPMEDALRLSELESGRRFIAPRAAFNAQGELLTAWNNFTCGADSCFDFRVEARLGNAAGVLGPSLTVTNRGAGLGLAALPSGAFLVAWNRPEPNDTFVPAPAVFGVRGRTVSNAGLGAEITLKEEGGALDFFSASPTVAVDALGNAVVFWQDRNSPEVASEIHGQLLSPELALRGERFELSPELTFDNLLPTAVSVGAGRFFLIWTETSRLVPGGSLVGQRFRLDGDRCLPEATRLCLAQRRFELTGRFRTRSGNEGPVRFVSLSDDSAYGWFFRPDNVETLVKFHDGRAVNGFRWLFYAGLTNVELELSLRDVLTGEERIYFKPQGDLISFADTRALPGADPGGSSAAPSPVEAPAASRGGAGGSGPQRITEGEVGGACLSTLDTLCLQGGRFAARLLRGGASGGPPGSVPVVPLTDSAGAFWFFRPSNLEAVLKVIDGRAVNGHFWVFYGSATNLPFVLEITDTDSGLTKTYERAAGPPTSFADTGAFPSP